MSFGRKNNKPLEDRPMFNQAALFIERLDNLEGMIDELIANNQISLACDLLKRVIVRIIPIAREKGVDYTDIERKVTELESDLKDPNNNLNTELIKSHFNILDGMIWQLQHTLGLVMPKFEKKPWHQEVEEDFE